MIRWHVAHAWARADRCRGMAPLFSHLAHARAESSGVETSAVTPLMRVPRWIIHIGTPFPTTLDGDAGVRGVEFLMSQ